MTARHRRSVCKLRMRKLKPVAGPFCARCHKKSVLPPPALAINISNALYYGPQAVSDMNLLILGIFG
jgi:hypothetical protein